MEKVYISCWNECHSCHNIEYEEFYCEKEEDYYWRHVCKIGIHRQSDEKCPKFIMEFVNDLL